MEEGECKRSSLINNLTEKIMKSNNAQYLEIALRTYTANVGIFI